MKVSVKWTCRLVRGGRAIWDGGETGGGFGAAHLAQCPDCQAYFAAGDELELALRADASRHFALPSDRLEERILRGVRQAQPARAPRHHVRTALAFGGVAACFVFAFSLLQQGRVERVQPASNRPMATVAAATGDQLDSLNAMLAHDPLQTEVDSVYADAQSALHFLAMNFLPSTQPGATPSSTVPRRPASG